MAPEETLAEAIRFGGGFTDKAYTYRLKVSRNTARAKEIIDVGEELVDSFQHKNGDVVSVDSILERYENRVEVLGAVFHPGEYALTEGMTVRELVKKAEGLREDAYVGRALLYRRGEDLSPQTLSIDLREVLRGEGTPTPLQRDDILQVYAITDLEEEYSVRIDGEVQDPGRYPYMKGISLGGLIAMAGGVKESAYQSKVDVARAIRNAQGGSNGDQATTAKTFQFDINSSLVISDEGASFELLPSDQVFVRRSLDYEPDQTVFVTGEVAYPGEYAITSKDESISDLVQRAGGVTPYAYEEGARLIRVNPAFYEEKILKDEALRDSLRYIRYQQYFLQEPNEAPSARQNMSNQSTQPVIVDIDDTDIEVPRYQLIETETQSIGIKLDRILDQPRSRYDIRLLPGDTLEVPRQLQTVRMSGEVLFPVSSRYDQSKGFKSYIAESGGFTRNADRKRSYIIYANGSVDRTRSFLFMKNYPDVSPGAEIIVPEKPPRNAQSAQQIAVISSLLATLSLVLIRIIDVVEN